MKNLKTILVTGANGQLGLSIKDAAINYPDFQFYFKNSTELDITNANSIKEVFSTTNFDYCINCAAYTNVEQAEKTPEIAFKINAEGVKNVANACKTFNITLIHISTDYVFDGEKVEPYTIDDTPNPINEYGKSKLLGEKYIQEVLKHYFIIRTSWLYSKIHGQNFYKTILEKTKKGETLKVTDQQTGCPTDTANLTFFVLSLIDKTQINYGVFHFTDGDAMTWYDFAKVIVTNNNLNSTTTIIRDNNYRSFARRPKFSVLKVL